MGVRSLTHTSSVPPLDCTDLCVTSSFSSIRVLNTASRYKRNSDPHYCNNAEHLDNLQSRQHAVVGDHLNVKPLRGHPDLFSPLYRAKENTQHPKSLPMQIGRHHLGRIWRVDYRG